MGFRVSWLCSPACRVEHRRGDGASINGCVVERLPWSGPAVWWSVEERRRLSGMLGRFSALSRSGYAGSVVC